MHVEEDEGKMFITRTDLGENSLFMESARASVLKNDFEKIKSDFELSNKEDEKLSMNHEDEKEPASGESSSLLNEVLKVYNFTDDIPSFNFEHNTFTRKKPEDFQQSKIRKTAENFITTHL